MSSIRLRTWKPEDLPIYREWLQPHHKWQQFDAPYDPPYSPEDIDTEIAKCLLWIEVPPQPITPRLVIANDQDQLIGTVNCYRHDHNPESIFIGIGIYDPNHWNGGIGAQALQLWIEALKTAYPELERIKIATWSGNVGMCKVAKKLGFEEAERHRNAYQRDGFSYDRITFQLIITHIK